MASSRRIRLGKHILELTNLEKILFPEAGVIKAEVIQYYHEMAPVILRHIKHRPLSFIRYPDGIHGEHLFQKNNPSGAPQWIQSVKMGSGEKKIDYMIATDAAALVWLANLACIEFHQCSVQSTQPDMPDYFVFDLDPPPEMPFTRVRDLALALGDHLRAYGYHPFAKTSGKKGIHVFVPIHRKWPYDTLKQTLKSLAQEFVRQHPEDTTLQIRKNARTDKLFVDIVRNNRSQTVVCPYSLRAHEDCTVSMPLTWEELKSLASPAEWTIRNVPEKIRRDSDAWEGFGSFATGLHDQVKQKKQRSANAALSTYSEKRNFRLTPEPVPADTELPDDAFVIHRHNASRLHYDLRLAQDGVLRSWAIPKGLPPAPGIKRLAVETEPHPAAYLDFEGAIPKGQYGAGEMWIFARGRYHITKPKKDGFYFRLESPAVDNEFRMHRMKGNEWILERVDPAIIELGTAHLPHMLAGTALEVPGDGSHCYEIKWDGIRAMLYVDDDSIRITSRSGRDISKQFPEIVAGRKLLKCTQAVFDGEIIVPDARGRPQFKDTVGRMHKGSERAIAAAARSHPAYCYLFDVLYLDGCHVIKEPLHHRKAWLKSVIKAGGHFRYSEDLDDGAALFDATREMGLEGIMAKLRDGVYTPGKRTDAWLKVKHRREMTCRIIGYTEGQGDRAPWFGALHIADAEAEAIVYVGKVGTGFTQKVMKEVHAQLSRLKTVKKPFNEKTDDDRVSTWVEPVILCDVQYASMTDSGTLREPVFLRLRGSDEF